MLVHVGRRKGLIIIVKQLANSYHELLEYVQPFQTSTRRQMLIRECLQRVRVERPANSWKLQPGTLDWEGFLWKGLFGHT